MEFIEGIGQRYLIGKANNVPQQLETLAKKQFSSSPANDLKAQANQASALPSDEKDQEIAKLRARLAETKLQKDARSSAEPHIVESSPTKMNNSVSEAGSVKSGSNKLVSQPKRHNGGGGSATALSKKATREMKERMDTGASTISKPSARYVSPPRGRRASTSTATAASHHNSKSNPGTSREEVKDKKMQSHSHNLDASYMGASSRKESSIRSSSTHKAASTAPSAHGGSRRGHSVGHGSEIGSVAATVAARPPPPPAAPMQVITTEVRKPAPMQHIIAETRRSVPMQDYEDEEPGLYVIEVEEDPEPIRKHNRRHHDPTRGMHVVKVASTKEDTRYRDERRGVVKVASRREDTRSRDGRRVVVPVSSSQGRTVYRVS